MALRECRGIAALSFDLDNTLIDRDAAARAWWHARLVAAGLGHHLEEALVRDGGGQTHRVSLFAWAAALGLGDAGELWPSFQRGIAAYIQPNAAVGALLHRLRQRYRVGILTDGSVAGQRAKLVAAGLTDLDGVVISAELGVRKPDDACFEAITAKLGVARNACLHIGDHPERDTLGALAAGLQAVHIGERGPPGVVTLSSVLQLPEILQC